MVKPRALCRRLALFIVLLSAAPSSGQQRELQEYYLQFKEADRNRLGIELRGQEQHVVFEAGGLRISLPVATPKVGAETGIRIPLVAKGDFEITTSFAILKEPAPADTGFGTRFTLIVWTVAENAATFSRMMHADGKTKFANWASPLKEGPAKGQNRMQYFATTAPTGRLRLERKGAEVSHHAAEGAADEFRLLHKYQLDDQDVREVQLVGTTGGVKAELDVRFLDLRIRAAALPTVPRAAPSAEAPAKTAGWLAGGLIAGLLLVAAAGLAVWIYVRRRRRAQ